jgi:hypothetical protein
LLKWAVPLRMIMQLKSARFYGAFPHAYSGKRAKRFGRLREIRQEPERVLALAASEQIERALEVVGGTVNEGSRGRRGPILIHTPWNSPAVPPQ